MATIRAYLVGIDVYQGGIAQLQGCVNDIDAIDRLLRSRASAAGDDLVVERLTDDDATRAAFVDGFRAFFKAAAPGDVALLYCSMHGSRQRTAPEFLKYEYDGLDETLVFTDSRSDTGRDLADKDLAVLVDEVTRRRVHMTVVLDSCHSGSGVRGLDADVGVRLAPPDLRQRATADYLDGADAIIEAFQKERLGGSNYVLLAACSSDQLAKETDIDGVARGAMSAALERALTTAAGPITNLQLHRAVSAAVRSRVDDQTPLLECPRAEDASRLFLGGSAAPGTPLFTASFIRGSWQLDAGLVHGLPSSGPGALPVELTLHPLTATDLSAAAAVAHATSTDVHSGWSGLEVRPVAGALDLRRTYRAIVRAWPQPMVSVNIAADVPDRAALLTALSAAAGVRVSDAAADLRVRVYNGKVTLSRPGSARSSTANRAVTGLEVDALVGEIVQVGRWLALSRLANPTSSLSSTAVHLDMLSEAGERLPIVNGGVEAVFTRSGAGWRNPRVAIRVGNDSSGPVFVQVLVLTDLHGFKPLLDGGSVRLGSGETVFVKDRDGNPVVKLTVPDGESRTTDLLKLIVSTQWFDAQSLNQPDMDPPTATRGTSGDKGIDLSNGPDAPVHADDWTTADLLVTTERPGDRVDVPGAGDPAVALVPGVRLQAHPGLRAQVHVSASAQASRSALVPLVPPVLAQDPANEPYAFVPTRSAGEEMDVLEIEFADTRGDLATAANVTPENPLLLTIDRPLEDDVVLLPMLFDGQDYLPVGIGTRQSSDQTVVSIDRLPNSDLGRRSLGGSLKILFRKLVLRPLGVKYDWPRLSLVTYCDGEAVYAHDPRVVGEALEGKASVLLLVHGIIGDTLGMTQAVAVGPNAIKDDFDAVLAFDYENLHTHITDNGACLAEKLRDVGIVPGGPTRLTAVVHSMGGLVSRCFIEQANGAPVIARLVTCGTPHGGSPWPKVEDYALAAVGLVLNRVLDLSGPGAVAGRIVGFLARVAEKVDNALDDMNPTSDLIRALAADSDPGLHYVVIRGTQPWPDPADDAKAMRIIAKVATLGFDALFHGEANDMAVGIGSATAVGARWARPPIPLDAECNHVTYFSSEAGLVAIRDGLAAPL